MYRDCGCRSIAHLFGQQRRPDVRHHRAGVPTQNGVVSSQLQQGFSTGMAAVLQLQQGFCTGGCGCKGALRPELGQPGQVGRGFLLGVLGRKARLLAYSC